MSHDFIIPDSFLEYTNLKYMYKYINKCITHA